MKAFVFAPTNEFKGKFDLGSEEDLSQCLGEFLKKTPISQHDYIEWSGKTWTVVTGSGGLELIEGRIEKQDRVAQQQQLQAAKQQELYAAQQQEALDRIHQLKAKCASSEWSLDDLQSIFQLVSQIPTTPQAIQEYDELSLAQNDLIIDVCKNPSLSEPLKIMYSNAQLEMQQQILNNLANGNSILQQSQKSRNLIGSAGMLGATKALSALGDISDTLGGDE
jgi:hypothetical protein